MEHKETPEPLVDECRSSRKVPKGRTPNLDRLGSACSSDADLSPEVVTLHRRIERILKVLKDHHILVGSYFQINLDRIFREEDGHFAELRSLASDLERDIAAAMVCKIDSRQLSHKGMEIRSMLRLIERISQISEQPVKGQWRKMFFGTEGADGESFDDVRPGLRSAIRRRSSAVERLVKQMRDVSRVGPVAVVPYRQAAEDQVDHCCERIRQACRDMIYIS